MKTGKLLQAHSLWFGSGPTVKDQDCCASEEVLWALRGTRGCARPLEHLCAHYSLHMPNPHHVIPAGEELQLVQHVQSDGTGCSTDQNPLQVRGRQRVKSPVCHCNHWVRGQVHWLCSGWAGTHCMWLAAIWPASGFKAGLLWNEAT